MDEYHPHGIKANLPALQSHPAGCREMTPVVSGLPLLGPSARHHFTAVMSAIKTALAADEASRWEVSGWEASGGGDAMRAKRSGVGLLERVVLAPRAPGDALPARRRPC